MAFIPSVAPKRTIVIYRITPAGVPIEPIADLAPGLTGNRITFDLIENESFTQSYTVTTDPLQDFTFATSNIHKNPRIMSVTGYLTPELQINAGLDFGPSLSASPPSVGQPAWNDVRLKNLQRLADQRMPVGIYTPRQAFPVCAITSIDAPWDPSLGKNTRITINFMEMTILSPQFLALQQEAMIAGNNQVAGGGISGGEASNSSPSAPASAGNAPPL